MSTRRIGLLGGTFDPIHCGHIDAALAADRALAFDELLVIPSNVPPHRPQPLAAAADRYAMAALAVEGMPHWRASDMELLDPSRSYTSATLQRMHERGYDWRELFFVIGADAFVEIESWKNFPAILDLAHFVVVSRPGLPVGALASRLPALGGRMVAGVSRARRLDRPSLILIDAPTADVASTAIRQRLATRQSIEGMVPAKVAEYIERHRLYTRSESAAGSGGSTAQPAAGRLHGED